ncbi:nucleotide disphospho-sugar-binding domain-containing protein, partial [Spirillospora sp. NPDC049652]
MRVLFVSYAERTHYFQMVPMAWALRTAGHEVRVASQPALADTVVRSGLPSVTVGRDHSFDQVLVEKSDDEGWAGRVANVLIEPDGVAYPDFVRFMDEATIYSAKVFNDPMVDDLVAYTRQWRPDLIVWEMFTFAGAVAARAAGIPHVRFLWGADVLVRMRQSFLRRLAEQPEAERHDPLGAWLAETAGRFGASFDEELVTGQHTLDQSPPSMRLPLGLPTVPVQYVPYNGPAAIPDWLREPPERPRVAVTAGISMRGYHGFDPIPTKTLQALGELDVEVVATLVPAEGETAELPDNVRTVDFVPMNALLPTCAAVVHVGA